MKQSRLLTLGLPRNNVADEVERYCVSTGQISLDLDRQEGVTLWFAAVLSRKLCCIDVNRSTLVYHLFCLKFELLQSKV